MFRALELARLGFGKVSPNPMVGCIIVCEGKIIGEGFHQQYGGPHAEVNAIYSVKDKSLLKQSTVYVTLEPCAHYGKTPPCASLLVEHEVKKVIVSNVDPNPLVSGKELKYSEVRVSRLKPGFWSRKG
jgi:diaminohydroxyphosphoribosylaminopyrimidine deaminase/5-amino-6-(5-phosphoribosylamino)uracil reductase